MAENGGMREKLEDAKDFAGDALHQAATAPIRGAKKIGKKVKGELDLTNQKIDHNKFLKPVKDAAVSGAKGTAKGIKEFKKSDNKGQFLKDKAHDAKEGIKNGAKDAIRSAPRKALNGTKSLAKSIADKSKLIKKIKQAIMAIQEAIKAVISFIATWGEVILIVGAIVIGLSNLIIMGIGVSQSISMSPHYYCDIDASKSVKSSAVYQQYCTQKDISWSVDNINGHYIVQDGQGPAAACAMLNMILRYYSIEAENQGFGNTNVYKYLWQADGQYNIDGSSVGTSNGARNSVRQVLNHYNETSKNAETSGSQSEVKFGSQAFAQAQGKSGYTMSNWGYLRDEYIDIKNYMQTKDFYDDQTDNAKWVWDLSLDNFGAGTSWTLDNWDIKVKMNSKTCFIEQMTCPVGDKGYEILKDRMMSILTTKTGDWQEYYKNSAGVLVKYTKTTGSKSLSHVILITKVDLDSDGNPTAFYGVDSSLGTSGGWEGPLNDDEARFVSDGKAIEALLKDSNNTITYNGSTYTLDKIGYCTNSLYT